MTHFSEQLIPHARLELLESSQLCSSGSGLGLVILAIPGLVTNLVTQPQSSRPLFSEQGLGMGGPLGNESLRGAMTRWTLIFSISILS